MIYLYGILKPASDRAPDETLANVDGVTGAVSVTEIGAFSIIHGSHDGSEILARRKLLLAHARVLETAMGFGTVLPMRFGMTCASRQDLEDLLHDAGPRLREAIDRVAGRVEIGVRVVAPEDAALRAALAQSPDLIAERDRLATLGDKAHFARAEFGRALGDVVSDRRRDAQKTLLAELKPLCCDHILKAPDTDFEPLRAEFLLEEDCVALFSERLDQTVSSLDFAAPEACTARIIGPGPAFHFVDLSLEAPGVANVA